MLNSPKFGGKYTRFQWGKIGVKKLLTSTDKITCERVSAAAVKALASSLSRSTANEEESHII
jgi:hypothetical protein